MIFYSNVIELVPGWEMDVTHNTSEPRQPPGNLRISLVFLILIGWTVQQSTCEPNGRSSRVDDLFALSLME